MCKKNIILPQGFSLQTEEYSSLNAINIFILSNKSTIDDQIQQYVHKV